MGKLIYEDLTKGGNIFNRWEQAVKDAIDGNADDILGASGKTLESIEALRNSIGDTIGDYLFIIGYHTGTALGGAPFRVVEDTPKRTVIFDPALTQGLTGSPMPNITAGQTIKIRFKLKTLSASGYLFVVDATSGIRLHLSTFAPEGDFSVNTQAFGTLLSIQEVYGRFLPISPNTLFLNTWYDVEIAADFDSNILGYNIANPFGTFRDVEVESYSIANEVFGMDEASGSTVTGSLGSTATLLNAPTRADFNVDNNFDLIQSGGIIYKRQINNNLVSPYDFGAFNAASLTDFSNDSYPALQAMVNSTYAIEPNVPGRFYISQSVIMRRPKVWTMAGGAVLETTLNDPLNDPSVIDEGTFIFSDQNIDYIVLGFGNIHIQNGCIYTASTPNHTKAAYRYDLSFDMWGGSLHNILVEGDRAGLLTTGVGTIGIMIDSFNATGNGFATWMQFSGRVRYCNKGVYINTKGVAGTFQNSFQFNLQGFGCKMFYDVETSSLLYINSICQDDAVLNNTEFGMYAFNINAGVSEVNLFVFDTARLPADDPNENRHEGFKYSLTGEGLMLGDRSKYYFNRRQINMFGVSPNKENLIIDPKSFKITNYRGVYSQLDNAIAYAGTEGHTTYIGYEATDDAWFDANLLPADDAGNPTTLSASANVTIDNADRLLSTHPTRTVLVSHTVADVPTKDLHFAEIVISDIPNVGKIGLSKILELQLALGVGRCLKVQCIIKWNSGSDYNQTFELPNGGFYEAENTFDLIEIISTPHTNNTIERVIIRIIGFDTDESRLSVRDIVLKTQYQVNKPILNTHGDQKFHGNFEFNEDSQGIILVDRTTGNPRRIFLDNGVLGDEAV